MTSLLKALFHNLLGRVDGMIDVLQSPEGTKDKPQLFLNGTVLLFKELRNRVATLVSKGDLDVVELIGNHIVQYNAYYDHLYELEVYQFKVLLHYGESEVKFSKLVARIYDEIGVLTDPPVVTLTSNLRDYYWVLPDYGIIAVPAEEEKHLLNLPDLYHEIGHLIYTQYGWHLRLDVISSINEYFDIRKQEAYSQMEPDATKLFADSHRRWDLAWLEEYACDLIGTYTTGIAYAWSHLKISLLSGEECNKYNIYSDSATHPSNASRMLVVWHMLKKYHLATDTELDVLKNEWIAFKNLSEKRTAYLYDDIYPKDLLHTVAERTYEWCIKIGLKSYTEQVASGRPPVAASINEGWALVLAKPDQFNGWEADRMRQILG